MYGHAFKSPAEKGKIDNEVGCMCARCVCVCVSDRRGNVKVPAYLCSVYLGC